VARDDRREVGGDRPTRRATHTRAGCGSPRRSEHRAARARVIRRLGASPHRLRRLGGVGLGICGRTRPGPGSHRKESALGHPKDTLAHRRLVDGQHLRRHSAPRCERTWSAHASGGWSCGRVRLPPLAQDRARIVHHSVKRRRYTRRTGTHNAGVRRTSLGNDVESHTTSCDRLEPIDVWRTY